MTAAESTPRDLTVADARALAELAGRRWVVVLAEQGDQTRYLTWGRSPEDKVYASDLAEAIADDLHGPDAETTVVESFKLDAARNKARVEQLEPQVAALRSALQAADDLLRRVLPDYVCRHGHCPDARPILDQCEQALAASGDNPG